MPSRVCLHHSPDRAENLRQVLAGLEPELGQRVKRAKRILIKPNLVHHKNALAVTPAISTAAVIEYLRRLTDAPITVGDASFHDTEKAFDQFGYRQLLEQFANVTLVDFNRAETVPATIFHAGMKEHTVRIAQAVAQADFRICLSPMKTHDHFILTLTIKNWGVGIIVAPERFGSWQRWPHFHAQGYRVSHESLVRLLKDFPLDLAVIDGWEGMEGDGPTSGDPVPMHLALAGFDPVAVDATASRLMGFDPADIGYLVFAQRDGFGVMDESQIAVRGNASVAQLRRTFAAHPKFHDELAWKDETAGRWASLRTWLPGGR